MTHQAASVTGVEDGTKRFGKVVRGVQDTRDEMHDNVTEFLPVLDGKVLDVDVARTFGRDTRIDHVDGRLVVTEQNRRARTGETKVGQDGTEVASMFSGTDGSVKFRLGGTGGGGRLGLALVGDTAAGEKESKASGRATRAKVISMSSIQKTNQVGGHGEGGKIANRRDRVEGGGTRGQVRKGRRAMEVDPPEARTAQVFDQFLEEREVEVGRSGRELAEGNDGVTDVGTACHIGIQNFAKKGAVRETKPVNEGLMFISVFRGAHGGVHGLDRVGG